MAPADRGSAQGGRPAVQVPARPALGAGYPQPSPLLRPPVRDINLSLWRQPELVKFDQSVFMNQGEWELLYVLSHFQEFSVKSSDSYAEMKFYVRALATAFLGDVARGKGLARSLSQLCAAAPACRWDAPAIEPFLWLTLVPPTILTRLGKEPQQLKASFQPFTAFSVSVLQVVIRRRPLFYTVSLLLPSIFLMVMDIVGFYLPPHSGERVSFKITLLLGYSVFLIIVSDTLPATAVGTPLIGRVFLLSTCHGSCGQRPQGPETSAGRIGSVHEPLQVTHLTGASAGIYFVVCMALLVISLTETILIVCLVHKQDLQPHVPEWLKHLLLERATILLCIRDRKKFSQSRTETMDTSRQVENNDSTGKAGTERACGN